MTNLDNLDCDDSVDAARMGLLALMRGISEEAWCAGWMMGLEFDLWAVREGRQDAYGQIGAITERQARLLRDLSDEADGWWRWGDTDGPTFVRLEEWRKIIGETAP